MTDLEEQPVPDAACPECGGEPAGVKHQLSDLGYLHDDIRLVCSECDNGWTKGVPIGQSDEFADDLRCQNPECDSYGLVHKPISPAGSADIDTEDPERFKTSLKCPECYDVWMIEREYDDAGVCCIGYPQVTGDTENADRSSW